MKLQNPCYNKNVNLMYQTMRTSETLCYICFYSFFEHVPNTYWLICPAINQIHLWRGLKYFQACCVDKESISLKHLDGLCMVMHLDCSTSF